MKRLIFWDFPRASWQYDIAVAVILAFIFITPKAIFKDQPRPASIVQMPSSAGGLAFIGWRPACMAGAAEAARPSQRRGIAQEAPGEEPGSRPGGTHSRRRAGNPRLPGHRETMTPSRTPPPCCCRFPRVALSAALLAASRQAGSLEETSGPHGQVGRDFPRPHRERQGDILHGHRQGNHARRRARSRSTGRSRATCAMLVEFAQPSSARRRLPGPQSSDVLPEIAGGSGVRPRQAERHWSTSTCSLGFGTSGQ